MSQQINLVLPELRPRFDWLGLPVVVAAAILGLLLVGGFFGYQKMQVEKLVAQNAESKRQMATLEQELVALGQTISGRKGDPALPGMIEVLLMGNEERQAVLKALDSGAGGGRTGFAGVLEGFSRQTIDGLWLTRFELAGSDIQIEGSALEPSLLPRFIEKLNSEAIFAGRRFAALEMNAVEPDSAPAPAPGQQAAPTAVAPAATNGTSVKPRVPLRHTQFVLRSTLPANAGGAR